MGLSRYIQGYSFFKRDAENVDRQYSKGLTNSLQRALKELENSLMQEPTTYPRFKIIIIKLREFSQRLTEFDRIKQETLAIKLNKINRLINADPNLRTQLFDQIYQDKNADINTTFTSLHNNLQGQQQQAFVNALVRINNLLAPPAPVQGAQPNTQVTIIIPRKSKYGIWHRELKYIKDPAVAANDEITLNNAFKTLAKSDVQLAANIDQFDSAITYVNTGIAFLIAILQAVKIANNTATDNADISFNIILDAVSAGLAAASIFLGAVLKYERDKVIGLKKDVSDSQKILRPQ